MPGMEPTRIIAIRHGETAWNVDARIQGQLDIPLNDTGRWQAQRLAQALAEREPLDAIYASDLSRAWETAQHISQATGTALHPHTGLRERHFGQFQGSTFAETERSHPDDAHRWRKRDPHWVPPAGGESLLAMRERVVHTVHTLAAAHPGQLIVLVAHGGVLDLLYRVATGQDLQAPRTWQLGNTSVNRLLWTPEGLTLVGWADMSHLSDGAMDEQAA